MNLGGTDFRDIRMKQQQKAVEEARRNFLNRRMGSTHGSDDEVEGTLSKSFMPLCTQNYNIVYQILF